MNKSCPICQNVNTEAFGEIQNYNGDALYCKKCNSFFPSQFPSEEEIVQFYQGFSYNCKVYTEHLRNTFIHKCSFIKKIISPWQKGNTLLDFGGGGGLYSKGFQDIGYDVKMTEIDDEAIKHAQNLGVQICNKDILTEKFDIIFSSHVIEHYKTPHDFFISVDKFVNPDGLLIVATPNKDSREFYRVEHLQRYKNLLKNKSLLQFIKNPWWCFDPPRHFYALSAKSFEKLANAHGYVILCSFSEYSALSKFMHNDMYSIKPEDLRKPKNLLYKLYVNACSFLFSFFDRKHGDNLVVIMKKTSR